jgi:hypothetical protein
MKTHIKCNLIMAAFIAVTLLPSCEKDELTPATRGSGFTEQFTCYHEPEQLLQRQAVDQNPAGNQDSNSIALSSVGKMEGK